MNKNIAVIGMGYWGKNLVRVFSELGALHTVCDQDDSRREVIGSSYPQAEFSTSFSDVLSNPEIGAVVLATPAASHYQMAHNALRAGKDVYVEKPLALELDQGEHLVELARKQGRILMVGHILRYHPAVRKLEELIREGALGRLQYVYSNRLNMGKIRTEENILWSFAPHDISVILALLGEEPASIECQGGAYLNQNVPDTTMSWFGFSSGVTAHIFVSWLHPFKEQRLVVVGSEKMAVFEDTAADKLVVYPHRVEWKNRIPSAVKAEAEKVELEAAEPLKEECRHFLACIESRKAPLTDGEEGLRVLRILRGCEDALRAGPGPRRKEARKKSYFVHETARVDDGCEIGEGTKIWHYSHVLSGARIGKNCIFGQNTSVAGGVTIGDNVKVQNNVSIYTGTEIEDDVFLGPSCVLTNVSNPRSQIVRHSLYEKTRIRRGATIGANATIVCGVTLGRYAFVSAGAVVTDDVPDYGLMMGVPAQRVGWMSRHGHWLKGADKDGVLVCPESGLRYRETEPGVLRCLDLDEDAPLPEEYRVGKKAYEELKG